MNLEPLKNLINSLTSFNTHDEVSNIVDNNHDIIVELQQQQLIDGKDIKGQDRVDAYAPLTVKIKKEYGQGFGAITDHVTFFMTGQLSSSLFYSRSADIFNIKSALPTFDKMVERIGNENYGLSPENREDFATSFLLPEFSKVFENKTGIKI